MRVSNPQHGSPEANSPNKSIKLHPGHNFNKLIRNSIGLLTAVSVVEDCAGDHVVRLVESEEPPHVPWRLQGLEFDSDKKSIKIPAKDQACSRFATVQGKKIKETQDHVFALI